MVLITGNDALVMLQGNVAMGLLVVCRVPFNICCSIVVFDAIVGIREFAVVGFRMLVMWTLSFCSGLLLLPTLFCFYSGFNN